MQALPLKKTILEKAKALGIKQIHIAFSGGNDEGMVDVRLGSFYNEHFSNEIEEWAYETYGYSGAGDGTDYGDDIIYDLETMTAKSSSWQMQRHDEDEGEDSFDTE